MPESALPKVVGVGLAALDRLLLWEDMNRPVVNNRLLDFQSQGGGMVGTALVTVCRLGGRAEYWGSVGTDQAGDSILEGLRSEGVDVSGVRRIEGGTSPVVVVCVDAGTGERRFLHFSQRSKPDAPVGKLESLKAAGCLLVDEMDRASALRAARRASEIGVPVVADLQGRIGEETRELLRFVDHAIVSEGCAMATQAGDNPRDACEALREMGPDHVAVTLGDRGCLSVSAEGVIELDAFEVEVVDTTGAGDVFHGAFCYGLAAGFELEHNLRYASAAAALACRSLGGRAGIPSREEVEELIERQSV